jgi:uncharacterized protein
MTEKIIPATPAALSLIDRLRQMHGDLMFHQSGGCCDGSVPICVPMGEFPLGSGDVLIGTVDGCPVYLSAAMHAYWGDPDVILDIRPGRGGGFSLEAPEGVRFYLGVR